MRVHQEALGNAKEAPSAFFWLRTFARCLLGSKGEAALLQWEGRSCRTSRFYNSSTYSSFVVQRGRPLSDDGERGGENAAIRGIC